VTAENPKPDSHKTDPARQSAAKKDAAEGSVENRDVDEFFQRLPGNLHWPKPNADAVAAAVEVIQRMSGGAAAAEELAADASDEPGNICVACGGLLPLGARFCVWCGVPHESSAEGAAGAQAAKHHFHHHYHHLVPNKGTAASAIPAAEGEAAAAAPHGRVPGSPGTTTGGRAETGARQVAQDWAQACNTKHIDDLLELYSADATVIRSSVPPVRSLPAIREFLISLLDAGLGDVEMESLRVEVMGDIAMDLGRCKMLVPVAMGKRREERGKYLVVLVKQAAGTWKILADCWSSDMSLSAPPPPDATIRKPSEPVPPLRKPR